MADATLTEAAGRLREAADRLLGRIGHWSDARWTPVRAQAVYDLAQRLADLGARAEGRPRQTVPRLPSAVALPDQVRVMVADLLAAANDDADTEAAAAITATHREL